MKQYSLPATAVRLQRSPALVIAVQIAFSLLIIASPNSIAAYKSLPTSTRRRWALARHYFFQYAGLNKIRKL
jgi:hypothetical protein